MCCVRCMKKCRRQSMHRALLATCFKLTLSLKELQSIQSKHSKPVKAAQELLNIVMDQSGNVYSCFLDALKKTGHQRVYKIIVSGSCKGVYMNNTHHREPNVECNIFAKLQISLNVYEFQ